MINTIQNQLSAKEQQKKEETYQKINDQNHRLADVKLIILQ
jgi:hypothetical protein